MIHYSPVIVTAWATWGGTLMLSFYGFDLIKELREAQATSTWSAVYLGVFPAFVANLTWSYVLNYWPASKAAIYLYSLPIVSTLMGFLILHEEPTFWAMSGGLLAMTGAICATKANISVATQNEVQKNSNAFIHK